MGPRPGYAAPKSLEGGDATAGVHCGAWRGGVASAVRAQPRERMRRIAFFTPFAADDQESLTRVAAFLQGMQELGWMVGRNLRIEYRFMLMSRPHSQTGRRTDRTCAGRHPRDSGLLMEPLLSASRAVPIVFVAAADPVGAGYVASLARPGGNATGFSVYEYGIGAKWLGLMKQIAPGVTRVAVIRNASIAGGAQFGAIQAVAPSLETLLRPIDPSDAAEMERALTEFAREPKSRLIVTGKRIRAIPP